MWDFFSILKICAGAKIIVTEFGVRNSMDAAHLFVHATCTRIGRRIWFVFGADGPER